MISVELRFQFKADLHIQQEKSDFTFRCNFSFEFYLAATVGNHYFKYKICTFNDLFPILRGYLIICNYGYSCCP